MTEDTKNALKQFANLDTWSSAHWADQDRFENFVIAAYRNGDDVSSEEFLGFFPELNDYLMEKAMKFYFQYENGKSLLRRFETGE